MRISSRLGRTVAAAVGVAVLGTLVVPGMAGPATAATQLGDLSVTPVTGTESTTLHGDITASCPAGSTGVIGYLNGPGVSTDPNQLEKSIIMTTRPVNTTFDFTNTFKDVFVANAIASPSGTYVVRIACLGADFFTEVGQFTQSVDFTPTGGANAATYVAKPATETTTTLATPDPVDPVLSGTSVTLQAAVDGGANGTPTGSVQFKAGATNLGTPVELTSGAASLSTVAIPIGTPNLTATYVPSGANALSASSSAPRAFVVAGTVALAGTARVGRALGCSTAAVTGATRSYLWLRNGVSTGVVAATVTVPSSWYNTTVSCRVTTSKGGKSVLRTSNPAKIALGAALVYSVRPRVLGIARVGRVLTCAAGTWRPAATAYRYQWFRGTRAIPRAVGVRYRAVRLDKGKPVTCRVIAIRAGYASGVAKAPARRIS